PESTTTGCPRRPVASRGSSSKQTFRVQHLALGQGLLGNPANAGQLAGGQRARVLLVSRKHLFSQLRQRHVHDLRLGGVQLGGQRLDGVARNTKARVLRAEFQEHGILNRAHGETPVYISSIYNCARTWRACKSWGGSWGDLISDEAQHTEAGPRAAPARKLQRAPGAAGWCAGRIFG